MNGRLSGEAKAAVKAIGVDVICSEAGGMKILEQLDKLYGVDSADQLDMDLAEFLDFYWKQPMSVEDYIAGFHSRLDKLSELNMNDKLKGHLLLRQAGLERNTRNRIVSAAAGNYEISKIANALRQAYRNTDSSSSSNHHSSWDQDGRIRGRGGGNRWKNRSVSGKSERKNEIKVNYNRGRSIFYSGVTDITHNYLLYTFNTKDSHNNQGPIIDSGVCSSVVGQDTLDTAMQQLAISSQPDSSIKHMKHRFGDFDEEISNLSFQHFTRGNKRCQFEIQFDVIPGSLPFLVNWPTLRAMKATLYCEFESLSVKVDGHYHRIGLRACERHVFLPFRSGKNNDTQVRGYCSPLFRVLDRSSVNYRIRFYFY